jgi:hypothetical protein
MAIVFANNASSLLSVSIGAGDTTIQLADSSAFPVPTGGDVFYVTLEDDTGDVEVVRCSGNNGTTTLTVDTGGRGVYGGAQAFTANVTRVECRLTKTIMDNFLQLTGGSLTGNLDLNSNNLVDAKLTGASTQLLAGEIVAVPLRGLAGASANEIAIPTDGTSRATAGGTAILVTGDDIVAELDTGGVINLNSATVGVRVPGTAYLRVEGTASTDFLSMSHDDTNFVFDFQNVGTANWNAILNMSANVQMNENQITQANLVDFQFEHQAVTPATTTNVDYTAGSYVTIQFGAANIAALNITNPPTTEFAAVRFKFTQDGVGGRSVSSWPGTTLWPDGVAPDLAGMAGNEVIFVDLWTDNGGTTWYGAYGGLSWS